MNPLQDRESLLRMFGDGEEIVREAGDFLLSRLNSEFRIAKKGLTNLVTEIDLESETRITEGIRRLYPDHQILAEERGRQESNSAFKWIIDPLDGTTNYAHGYRFFCVSIAVEYEKDILFGLVYDPVTRELFKAIRGGGAFLNDRPIRCSTEDRLGESLICTGFSYDRDGVVINLVHFNNLILEARGVRRDGSAALDLCYVACGRFDGFWEISLNPWDVAAGKIIVEEAGGRISSFRGDPCTVYDAEILATNGRIHEQVMRILAKPASSSALPGAASSA